MISNRLNIFLYILYNFLSEIFLVEILETSFTKSVICIESFSSDKSSDSGSILRCFSLY